MENNLNSDSQLNNETPNLEQVIKQSTENVMTEIQEKTQKKRGRKPKSQTENKLNPLLPAKTPELVKIEKAQYKAGIQMCFQLFGSYMAKAFKYEGFELNREELEALGDSGSECAHHFMPAVDPKWVALGGFVMVTGGIYAMKVVAYNEYKNSQLPKNDDGVKKD